MDVRLTWKHCDEAGDYVVPIVLSPIDLVPRPDNMDETVHTHTHTYTHEGKKVRCCLFQIISKIRLLLLYLFIDASTPTFIHLYKVLK